MPRLWLINQFANTPDLPGHTRQFEVAAGLVASGWQVEVFASDFNLTQRQYRRLRFPQLRCIERPAGIRWTWLWVSPYPHQQLEASAQHAQLLPPSPTPSWPSSCFWSPYGPIPDVILASSPQLPAAFTCLLIARLTGINFVLEVRDLWPQVLIDQGGKSPTHPMVRLLAWMERQLYRHALMVVVLAKGAEPFVRNRGARQTAWLPNGPDLDLFSSRPLPPDRDVFTVLYAGAHGDANALENVISAARLLELRRKPVRFRFVGDGPEKRVLMRLAIDLESVSFEAPIPKVRIPDLMEEADAILLSLKDVPLFRYGVSPNKLYDAYALGRPVITTVAGDINGEVEDHSLGVTAPPGDPQALAAAIQRLMSTPRNQRQAMAERAIHLANTIYSRQRINSKYNILLRNAIDE